MDNVSNYQNSIKNHRNHLQLACKQPPCASALSPALSPRPAYSAWRGGICRRAHPRRSPALSASGKAAFFSRPRRRHSRASFRGARRRAELESVSFCLAFRAKPQASRRPKSTLLPLHLLKQLPWRRTRFDIVRRHGLPRHRRPRGEAQALQQTLAVVDDPATVWH